MTAPEREALVTYLRAYAAELRAMASQLCAMNRHHEELPITERSLNLLAAADMIEALSAAPTVTVTEGWRDGSTAPEDGTEIIVGVTYRYALYKPDGARQMKKPGRWQRMGEFGWENCEKPERWSPLKSTTPQTGSQE